MVLNMGIYHFLFQTQKIKNLSKSNSTILSKIKIKLVMCHVPFLNKHFYRNKLKHKLFHFLLKSNLFF